MKARKFNYNTKKYDFYNIFSELYNTDDLHNLHLKLNESYKVEDGLNGLGKDTDSEFHMLFYDKVRSGWQEFNFLYQSFIKEQIIPKISDEVNIFQTFPSYRIQYPHSKAITTVHCDSDENHKHPNGEINILVPITTMYDTSAVWAESEPGCGDFKPMNCVYGEYYIWNGNKCLHYNKSNVTENTRISMDFRVLPNKFYNNQYSKFSATSKKKFIIGDYYSKIGEQNV